MKPIHRISIFTIVVAMSQPLLAQSTWTGAGGNWSTAANWSPSGVPASGANIIIADPTTNGITLDGTTSRTVGSITFGPSGTRTSSFTIATQTTTNSLTIGGGVIANGALTGTTNVLTMRGNYIVSANQGWSVGGTANGDNGVFVRGVSDSANALPTGSLVLNANLTKSGTGQLDFASVQVSGTGNLITDSGTLKFNAGSNQPLIVGGSGNVTMNGSSTLTIAKNSGTLSVTRAIVMNATSTLSPRSNTVDIASSIAFNGTHTLDPNNTTNLTGAWTGSGTVNRSGSGTLNLTGSLTGFTGTLNLNAGTNNLAGPIGGSVAVTAGTTTFGGNVGGSLSLAAGATLSGEITATGGLTLQGGTFGADPTSPPSLGTSGNLNLSGTNTVVLTASPSSTAPFTILAYSGSLTGGAANLTLLGGAANYRSVTFNDTTPGIITLALGSASRTWTGALGTTWDVNTTLNWQEGDQKFLQLDAVTFGDTGAGTVALTGVLVPGSITVNSTSDYNFTGDAANYIGGGAGLTKSGSGVLSLGGVNTFNGSISVNGGILRPTGNQALGANGKSITIAAGATLDTNGAMTANRDYRAVISGTGVDGTGAIVNSAGDHSNGFRSLTLSADAAIGGIGRWDLRPINAGEGLLDLAGHTLTKLGSNKIAIIDSVASTNGVIEINEGTLAISRSTISGSGSVNVNPGAILYFENNTSGSFSKNVVLNTGTILSGPSGGGTLVPVDSQITLTDFPIFQTDVDLTVTGAIAGAGSLTKNGTAALILTGAATHAGGTTINTGTLQIGAGGTTGSIAGDINNLATVSFNRSDTYTYNGVISGTGALTKQGAGTLILNTANDFTGQKTIFAGSVVLRSTTGLGGTAAFVRFTGNTGILDLATNTSVAPYTFTIGAGNSGTILSNVAAPGPGINHTLGYVELSTVTLNVGAGADVSGGDPRVTIPNLNLSAGAAGTTTLSPTTANITLGPVTIGTGNFAKTLSLGGTSQNNQVTGTIVDGLNTLTLRKDNTSMWTLSGDNTFTGNVAVDKGVMLITHTNAFGSTGKTLYVNGNTNKPELRLSGGISPTVAVINLSGAGVSDATGAVRNISGTNTLTATTEINMTTGNGGTTLYSDSGSLTIATPLFKANTTGRVLTLSGPGNGVINAVIANGTTVNLPVTKIGTGTWTLNGAQTYSGATTVSEGVLSLGQAALNDVAAVAIAAGAVLNLNFSGIDQVGSLTINGVVKPDGVYTSTTDPGFITGTGSIRVGAAPQGYASWAAGYPFSVGVNDGPTNDPDGDGIPNLLEYVFGGIPVGAGASNTSILPSQTLTTTDLVLTFKRSDLSESDAVLKVQWSDNLTTWNDFATIGAVDALPAVDISEDSPTADLDTVVVTIPKSTSPGGKLFGRVQAVK